MYAEWLVFSGFRVAEASTADEAMEKARRLRPAFITTDIGVLGDSNDGCSLCERLKTDARTKEIPVIALTAWEMGAHFEHAQNCGCGVVLVKPCLPSALLTEIQRLLNRTNPKPKRLPTSGESPAS
jgi:CheY-like chemotaxis protein